MKSDREGIVFGVSFDEALRVRAIQQQSKISGFVRMRRQFASVRMAHFRQDEARRFHPPCCGTVKLPGLEVVAHFSLFDARITRSSHPAPLPKPRKEPHWPLALDSLICSPGQYPTTQARRR